MGHAPLTVAVALREPGAKYESRRRYDRTRLAYVVGELRIAVKCLRSAVSTAALPAMVLS